MCPGLLHPVRDPPRPRVGLRHLQGARLLLSSAFFDDDYYRVLEPFHPEAEARTQISALRELLRLAQSDRILDLGCGWGRHLQLLRDAGHDVTGVDLSLPLLRRAGGDHDLVAGDMLRLPFRDGTFDVVLNLATSLGLFLDDAPAITSLTEAARVLRPGGRLLLEGMNRHDVEANYASRDRWFLADGTEVRARRWLDPRQGTSHEVLRWHGPGGEGKKSHSLRLRTASEMTKLVEEAGLTVGETFGSWEGEDFNRDSELMILVAARPLY